LILADVGDILQRWAQNENRERWSIYAGETLWRPRGLTDGITVLGFRSYPPHNWSATSCSSLSLKPLNLASGKYAGGWRLRARLLTIQHIILHPRDSGRNSVRSTLVSAPAILVCSYTCCNRRCSGRKPRNLQWFAFARSSQISSTRLPPREICNPCH
jgi:hypothetical protein